MLEIGRFALLQKKLNRELRQVNIVVNKKVFRIALYH